MGGGSAKGWVAAGGPQKSSPVVRKSTLALAAAVQNTSCGEELCPGPGQPAGCIAPSSLSPRPKKDSSLPFRTITGWTPWPLAPGSGVDDLSHLSIEQIKLSQFDSLTAGLADTFPPATPSQPPQT